MKAKPRHAGVHRPILGGRRYVYLAELDSVRKTEDEIAMGIDALARALMDPRSVVVMSLNQITDSTAVLRCFVNEDIRADFMELFARRRIVVALYGSYESLIHYTIDKLDKNIKDRGRDSNKRRFVFSTFDFYRMSRFSLSTENGRRRLNAVQKAMLDVFKYNSIGSFDRDDVVAAFNDPRRHHNVRLYLESLLQLSISGIGYVSGKGGERVSLSCLVNLAKEHVSGQRGQSCESVRICLDSLPSEEGVNERSEYVNRLEGRKDLSAELASQCKQVIDVAYIHTVKSNIEGFEFDKGLFFEDLDKLIACDFKRPGSEVAGGRSRTDDWWVWNANRPPFDTAVRLDELFGSYLKEEGVDVFGAANLGGARKGELYDTEAPPSVGKRFYLRHLAQVLFSMLRVFFFIVLLGAVSAVLGELLALDDDHNFVAMCFLLLVSALVSDVIVRVIEIVLGSPSYAAAGERFRRLLQDAKVMRRYLFGRTLVSLQVDSKNPCALAGMMRLAGLRIAHVLRFATRSMGAFLGRAGRDSL